MTTAGAWTVLLAAAYPSSGAPSCPFAQVQTGCRSLAGGAGGAGGGAALTRLAAGAILCARFRPAGVLALPAGPRQPAPLALVGALAPAAAKLLLLPRFKGFSLLQDKIRLAFGKPAEAPVAAGRDTLGSVSNSVSHTEQRPFGTIPPPILARFPRDNNSGIWHSGQVILSRKCGGKQ